MEEQIYSCRDVQPNIVKSLPYKHAADIFRCYMDPQDEGAESDVVFERLVPFLKESLHLPAGSFPVSFYNVARVEMLPLGVRVLNRKIRTCI